MSCARVVRVAIQNATTDQWTGLSSKGSPFICNFNVGENCESLILELYNCF